MRKILFKIRYWLMPSELKNGSWLIINGDALKIDEMWIKSKKKGWWHIPRIDMFFKETP